MRVGIDGFNLALQHGTGIATYGLGLAQAIKAAGHEVEGYFGVDVGDDREVAETRFFDAIGREARERSQKFQRYRDYFRGLRPVRMQPVPLTEQVVKSAFADRFPEFDRIFTTYRLFRVANRRFSLSRRFLTIEVDRPPEIMHWTYPLPIRLSGAVNIYTLHDLVPLKLPYTTLDDKNAYHALVKACVDAADHIVTVSDASRDDIVDAFGAARGKITNLSQAIPARIAAAPDDRVDPGYVEAVFGLPPQSYFLFFGATEPKKNLGRLIEAYLSLRTDTKLVIVTGRSWQSANETFLLDAALDNHEGRVIRLNYLSRHLLDRLIAQARAVTFPSLYEGFGLPALEAMALGAPVITSRTSSMPEVAGNAALLVDPYDVADIRSALERIDGDTALRDTLRQAGMEQARKFSQQAFIARLDQFYRSLVR